MKTCARKKIVIAFAFLCISFCLPPAFAATMPPGPKQQAPEPEVKAYPSLQVKQPYYNFGEIQEGAEVEHEFTVSNKGREVLNIERVRVD